MISKSKRFAYEGGGEKKPSEAKTLDKEGEGAASFSAPPQQQQQQLGGVVDVEAAKVLLKARPTAPIFAHASVREEKGGDLCLLPPHLSSHWYCHIVFLLGSFSRFEGYTEDLGGLTDSYYCV